MNPSRTKSAGGFLPAGNNELCRFLVDNGKARGATRERNREDFPELHPCSGHAGTLQAASREAADLLRRQTIATSARVFRREFPAMTQNRVDSVWRQLIPPNPGVNCWECRPFYGERPNAEFAITRTERPIERLAEARPFPKRRHSLRLGWLRD